MKSYVFRIVIEPDKFPDGRAAFHAFAPALKGCGTWGHTHMEALANVQQAVELYLKDLVDAGQPITANPGDGMVEFPDPVVAVNVMPRMRR